MILNSDIRIKTDRLILKPVEEAYADDINTYFTPEVTRYMPFNPEGNINDVLSFVNSSKNGLLNNTDLVMVAVDADKNFMGCCGIHNISPESIEVGLWLKKSAQGIGLGTEIVASLIQFIEGHFTFEYILYPVDEENIASKKIPEKLGFIPYKKYQKSKGLSSHLNIVEYRKYYSQ
ncbi:GNAT family N-acetyltransferase [Chryseobacterium sp. MIQD13]|uniref:GNAT family N-acetyltransferase n=1 Tax=Chryseobacterium sp. MIQD13 TaxID=3422310 RepID=UPI003D2BA0A7